MFSYYRIILINFTTVSIAESTTGKTIGVILGSISAFLAVIVVTLCYRRKFTKNRKRSTIKRKWSVSYLKF